MEKSRLLYMNTTSLAFLGDAVYEVYVRENLLKYIHGGADELHRTAVKFVKAEAQAEIMKKLLDNLSEDELGLVKRARNKRSVTKPKNADPVLYKWATAFEALIGYLHLSGNRQRMEEIIDFAIQNVKPGDVNRNGEKKGKKQI